jgi:DNA invertase Pin-like site-specific DNA recombinase
LRLAIDGKNVKVQINLFKSSGASNIVQEKPAGTKPNRAQLDNLIADVRVGDTVVVSSLYRIAKNTKHLLEIVESLNATGTSLMIIDNAIDTSKPHG